MQRFGFDVGQELSTKLEARIQRGPAHVGFGLMAQSPIPKQPGSPVAFKKIGFFAGFRFNPWAVNLLGKFKTRFLGRTKPEHLRRGELGERAAKKHLQKLGLKFLTANFRSERGEIDLIFREPARGGWSKLSGEDETACLVFIEVKTRSSEEWTRPAAAVDA